MEPQYPRIEDVVNEDTNVEPEPVFKSVTFHYGKNITGGSRVYGWYEGANVHESQLDELVKWGEFIAKLRSCYITLVAIDSDDFKVIHGCAPTDFQGIFTAAIEMTPFGNKDIKRRILFLDDVTDVDRVKEILLDRRYDYSQTCAHYTMPGSKAMYVDAIYNGKPEILIGPHRANELRMGDVTGNYEKLYGAIGQAIANTSIANYDRNTGVYRYLLLGQEALGENLERLERVLHRAGWSNVKFTVETHCLILELD